MFLLCLRFVLSHTELGPSATNTGHGALTEEVTIPLAQVCVLVYLQTQGFLFYFFISQTTLR